MSTSNSTPDLNEMLNSIRIQIQLFEACLRVTPRDRELRRRIEQAKVHELVVLAELSEQPVN
jgi:hypothetical protein